MRGGGYGLAKRKRKKDATSTDSKRQWVEREEFGATQLYFGQMEGLSLLSQEEELRLGRVIREGQNLILGLAAAEADRWEGFARLKHLTADWRSIERTSHASIEWLLAEIRSEAGAYLADQPRSLRARRLKNRLDEIEAEVAEASEKMIEGNLRLAVNIAKRHIYRGLPFTDLIQEGNLGLMKAVARYNYETGYRFSTFASWWIRQTISRAVYDQSRTIRIPVHCQELRGQDIQNLLYAQERAGRRAHHDPDSRTAGRVGGQGGRGHGRDRRVGLPGESGGDDGDVLGDFIQDDEGRDPFESAMSYELSSWPSGPWRTWNPGRSASSSCATGWRTDRNGPWKRWAGSSPFPGSGSARSKRGPSRGSRRPSPARPPQRPDKGP